MSCFRFVLFLQILPHFIQLHVLPVAQPRDMCGRLMAHCSSSILMLSSSKLAKEIGRKSLQSDSISYIIKLQLCLEKPFKNKKKCWLWDPFCSHLHMFLQTEHSCLDRRDKTLTWLMDMVFCWRLYVYSTKPQASTREESTDMALAKKWSQIVASTC